MIISPKSVSNFIVKLLFTTLILLTFQGLSVQASAKDDAATAVTKFLQAQKNCSIDAMMNHSQYFLKIDNLKEFYTELCKKNH